MNSTLILVLISIFLLFLIFPFLYFFRRRVELRVENNVLVLEYPFSTKKIDLEKELESWELQKAYYLRWGLFYSINMRFRGGKRIAISSLFNQVNYDTLFRYLNSYFPERSKGEKVR